MLNDGNKLLITIKVNKAIVFLNNFYTIRNLTQMSMYILNFKNASLIFH